MVNTQIEDLNNLTCAKREDFEEALAGTSYKVADFRDMNA